MSVWYGFFLLFFRDRLVFSFVICLGLAVHVHFLFVYNFMYKFFSRIISSYCLKFTSVSYTSQTSSRHAAQTSERCITQQFRRQKPCPFDIMICRFGRLFPRLLPWIDRLTAPFLHTTENSLVNAAQASEHCITQYYIYIYIYRGSFVRSCYGSPVWSVFSPPSCRSRTASKFGPQLSSVRLTARRSVCYIIQTYVRYTAQTYVRYTVQTYVRYTVHTYVRYTGQTYVRYTVQTSVRYTVHTYVRYTGPTSVGYTTQTCYKLQLHRTDFSFTTQTSVTDFTVLHCTGVCT